MHDPGEALDDLRRQAPLVHCVTNFVAMTFAANALLAAGASPAMVHAVEEAEAFAAGADALTINIGTLSSSWLPGMEAAARGASGADKPWVLDPVAVFASEFRRDACARLLALNPTAVRGNASEILALGGASGAGRGADTGDSVEAAAPVAMALAERTGAVVAVTGAVDVITDGKRVARIENGHPLMTRVTAVGCAVTALQGAFLATDRDPFEATVAALAYVGLAGERAAARAEGPGTFAPHFLDALAVLDADALTARHRRR